MMATRVKSPIAKLKEIQDGLQLSNTDLARSINVHPMTISKYYADPDTPPGEEVTERIDNFYQMYHKMQTEKWFSKLIIAGTIGGMFWLLLRDYDKK